LLTATAAVIGVTVAIPFSPLAPALVSAEFAKAWFYRGASL
jgi:hypothetical protein